MLFGAYLFAPHYLIKRSQPIVLNIYPASHPFAGVCWRWDSANFYLYVVRTVIEVCSQKAYKRERGGTQPCARKPKKSSFRLLRVRIPRACRLWTLVYKSTLQRIRFSSVFRIDRIATRNYPTKKKWTTTKCFVRITQYNQVYFSLVILLLHLLVH